MKSPRYEARILTPQLWHSADKGLMWGNLTHSSEILGYWYGTWNEGKPLIHCTCYVILSNFFSRFSNEKQYSHISDRKVKSYASFCVITILEEPKETNCSVQWHNDSHSNIQNSWTTNEVGWGLHVVFQGHNLYTEFV